MESGDPVSFKEFAHRALLQITKDYLMCIFLTSKEWRTKLFWTIACAFLGEPTKMGSQHRSLTVKSALQLQTVNLARNYHIT